MSDAPIAYGIEYRGHVIRMGSDALIGRSPACKVVLHHPDVSRRHARLAIREDGVYLEDLGSANGVFVNGERVAGTRRLQRDDEIAIGEERMRFVHVAPRPPRPRQKPPRVASEVDLAFQDLWDDEHDASFEQGEVTRLSNLADTLAARAEHLLSESKAPEAAKVLETAFSFLSQRAASGGRKVKERESNAVAAAALRLEAHLRNEEGPGGPKGAGGGTDATGAPHVDWLARLAELFAATASLPSSDLVPQLRGAFGRASPEATARWRRHLEASEKTGAAPEKERARALLQILRPR